MLIFIGNLNHKINMEAKELRIGNWVHHKDVWSHRQSGVPISIGTHEFDFQWDDSDWYALGECTLSLKAIEPIPLTEEWLLRFGGVLYPWGWNFTKNNAILFRWKAGDYSRLWVEIGNGHNVYIYCVHQLQNLFYALTGQELEIKELATV